MEVYIQVHTPCNQSWEEMQDDANGKFCQKCQHSVVDFTQMSDAQIVKILQNGKPFPCGRFRQSQLNRPFTLSVVANVTPLQRRHYLMPLVGSVLLFAHFQSSFAQGSPPPQVAATHYTTPTQIKETPDAPPTEYLPTRTLRIQLKEAYGHRSISGNVKICLVAEKRDTMGATQTVVTPIFSSPTNENGFIEWEVPIEYRNKKLSIIASGRYYMQEGTIVDLSRLPESYKYKELVFNRTLKLEGVILGMGGFSGAGKNENGEN